MKLFYNFCLISIITNVRVNFLTCDVTNYKTKHGSLTKCEKIKK